MKKLGVFLFAAALGATLVPLLAFAAASFYVDGTTGNVGIGNTTPASPLDVSGAMYSRLVTDTDASSVTVNWNSGNVHSIALSTSDTTFTFSNGQAGGEYDLILDQDATGGRTVTWPASVKWPGGSAPTLTSAASSTDMVSFVYDGSSYFGHSTLNYQAPASIAFVNALPTQAPSNGTSGSASIDCTGANFLVVDTYGETTSVVTGVTFDGTAMTQVAQAQNGSSASYITFWVLHAPASGSQNVVESRSSSGLIRFAASCYSGVAQADAVDASNSTQISGSGNQTISMTSTTNGDWFVETKQDNTSNPDSVVNGTLRGGGVLGSDFGLSDSNGSVGAAGSHTIGYHYPSSNTGLIIGVALAP
jgi:hypothetical protein